MTTKVQTTEGTEATLIAKAREAREEGRQSTPDEEMRETKARARQYAQNRGVHVADGMNPARTLQSVAHQMDETLGHGQIRVGDMVLGAEAARLSGIVDDDGNLTERGQELASRGGDGDPSPSSAETGSARQAEGSIAEGGVSRDTYRTQPPQGFAFGDGFNYVSLRRGASLESLPEAEVRSLIGQLRGLADGAGAREDIGKLRAELDRRSGAEASIAEDNVSAAQDPDDASEDTSESEGTAEDVAEAISDAFEAGAFDAIVEGAAVAIPELERSEAYRGAVDAWLSEGRTPDSEAIAAIGGELGIPAADADALVDVVVAGHAAEARTAVEPIVGAENVDGFADFLRLSPDLMRKGATHAIRGNSLGGWQSAAREYREALADFEGVDLSKAIGKHADGGQVWQDPASGQLLYHRDGRTVHLTAALASGFASILD